MTDDWTARLCLYVPGLGIGGVRSPWWELPQWKFLGGNRRPKFDKDCIDTMRRSTYREGNIKVPRSRITLVTVVKPLERRPVYIGKAIMYQHELGDYGPRPGVREEFRFFFPGVIFSM